MNEYFICENPKINKILINEIRYWHCYGALQLPQSPNLGLAEINHQPSGMKALSIDYGLFYSGNPEKKGSLLMLHGQYEVKAFTSNNKPYDGSNYHFQDCNYSHVDISFKFEVFKAALENSKITSGTKAFSAIVYLTAECCRSTLMEHIFSNLLKDQKSFDEQASLIQFAIKNYGQIAEANKIQIHADFPGNHSPLKIIDYIAYVCNEYSKLEVMKKDGAYYDGVLKVFENYVKFYTKASFPYLLQMAVNQLKLFKLSSSQKCNDETKLSKQVPSGA